MVGFFYHSLFKRHLEQFGHLEQPERVRIIEERVRSNPALASLEFIEALPAEREWLTAVHKPSYVDNIISLRTRDAVVLDWGDTVATEATPQAAATSNSTAISSTQRTFNSARETTPRCNTR